jgi:hypothetical protein
VQYWGFAYTFLTKGFFFFSFFTFTFFINTWVFVCLFVLFFGGPGV